jgi:Cys-rich protein (TIGR01571 family)
MYTVSFFVVLFASTAHAVTSSDCAPSDTQCLTGSDMNSMIQSHTFALKQALTVIPKSDNNLSATLLAFQKLMMNTTAALKGKMMNATAADAYTAAAQACTSWASSTWGDRLVFGFFSWLIYLVLAFLIWTLLYPPPPDRVSNPGDIEDPVTTFQKGHFKCFDNPGICLCACCCPGLRWADTMSLFGFLRIGVGLTLVFLCALFNGFVGCIALAGPFTLALALYYRHSIRTKFGMESWSPVTCGIDCVYLLCCFPCALAQEARVVMHYLQKDGR